MGIEALLTLAALALLLGILGNIQSFQSSLGGLSSKHPCCSASNLQKLGLILLLHNKNQQELRLIGQNAN